MELPGVASPLRALGPTVRLAGQWVAKDLKAPRPPHLPILLGRSEAIEYIHCLLGVRRSVDGRFCCKSRSVGCLPLDAPCSDRMPNPGIDFRNRFSDFGDVGNRIRVVV